jgi:Holliday junction resolvase
MVNSRDKGKRGEREWAGVLRDEGFTAYRGSQYSGKTPDGLPSPDIHCPDLPIHWEVKRTNKLNLRAAVNQAKDDSRRYGAEHWAVAWREDNGEWLIITDRNTHFAAVRGDFADPRTGEGVNEKR